MFPGQPSFPAVSGLVPTLDANVNFIVGEFGDSLPVPPSLLSFRHVVPSSVIILLLNYLNPKSASSAS